MEDQWGTMINNNRGSGISLMMREGEEFQKVEVWDVVRKERENKGDFLPKQRKSFSSSSSSSSAPGWRLALPSAPKMVIQRAKSWGNEDHKFSLRHWRLALPSAPKMVIQRAKSWGNEDQKFSLRHWRLALPSAPKMMIQRAKSWGNEDQKFSLRHWRLAFPSAPKMVIQRAKSWGNEDQKFSLRQSSAALKIPDWSQICKKKPKKGNMEFGENGEENGYFVEEDEENEDEGMIPPHEYTARRLARSRIASYSMCEGIGRTLKGRDLCKLRNAILTQTGFLEE